MGIDNAQWLGKDLEGGSCDLFEDTALEFPWKTKGNKKGTSIRAAGDQVCSQTRFLLNRCLKSYRYTNLLGISSATRHVFIFGYALISSGICESVTLREIWKIRAGVGVITYMCNNLFTHL
jgi:hypothetical protein